MGMDFFWIERSLNSRQSTQKCILRPYLYILYVSHLGRFRNFGASKVQTQNTYCQSSPNMEYNQQSDIMLLIRLGALRLMALEPTCYQVGVPH